MSSVYGSTVAGAFPRADIAAWMTPVPYLPRPGGRIPGLGRLGAALALRPVVARDPSPQSPLLHRWFPAASRDRAEKRLAEVGRSRIARARGLSAVRRKHRRTGQPGGQPFLELPRAPARRRLQGRNAGFRT